MKNFVSYSEDPENVNKFEVTVPSAKKDPFGNYVTAPSELAKEYRGRLRTRPVRPDLGSLEQRKRRILIMKLKLAASKRGSPWSMSDLEKALKDLKNNKSRDPAGLINELFKMKVIGDDLKRSLLVMLNSLKYEQIITILMNYVNVSTVHKKGSHLRLKNERGIFRVPVLQYKLMRMIYNFK